MTRLAPALLACLALGACTSPPENVARRPSLDEIATGSVSTVRAPPLVGERIASGPAGREGELTVALPSWVGPRGPTEVRRFEDGYTTVAPIGRTPRNAEGRDGATLGVRLIGEGGLEGSVSIAKPTEAGIRAELAEQFPDVDMKVTGRSARNTYGPYGFAVGRRADGTRCLYAWQWVDDVQPRLGKTEARIPGSVRVRLCHADLTFEALAASIDQLKLVPDGRALATSRPPSQRRGGRRAVRTTALSPTAAIVVAAGGHSRRYLAPGGPAAPFGSPRVGYAVSSATTLPTPLPISAAGPAVVIPAGVHSRRYLAPPGPAAPFGSPVVSFPVPSAKHLATPLPVVSESAAATPRSLTSDLPAEAFRGPRPGPARTGPPPG